MSSYMLLCNFTDQGMRTIKDAAKRRKAARELAKKLGVEIKTGYLAIGLYDLVIHAEAPNDEALATYLLSLGRFETRWLAAPENLSALADLSAQWIDLVHGRRPPRGIVLDMDSSVSPTHGEQENSGWNGLYACTCYPPLFVFNQFGDLERCTLRPGNVHSADGWEGVLKPVVERYQGKVSRIYFRADAAFAMPEVYEFLEAE